MHVTVHYSISYVSVRWSQCSLESFTVKGLSYVKGYGSKLKSHLEVGSSYFDKSILLTMTGRHGTLVLDVWVTHRG